MTETQTETQTKTISKAFDGYYIARHLNLFLKSQFEFSSNFRLWCDFEADSFTELSATISLNDPFWGKNDDLDGELVVAEKFLKKRFSRSLDAIKDQLIKDLKSWTSNYYVDVDQDGAHLFLWSDTSMESFEEDTKILMTRLNDLIGKSRTS